MKKLFYVLLAILIISALQKTLSPTVEVRYNTYNKAVDCSTLQEGCAYSRDSTVIQTWASFGVIFSSLGILGLASVQIGKSLRLKK